MRPVLLVLLLLSGSAAACLSDEERGGRQRSSGSSSTESTASTASSLPPAPPGVVIAAGDIAECPLDGDEATAAVVERLLAEHPGAVVAAVGDLAYERGTATEYRDCYGPSWGRFKDRTRPAVGNHEYGTGQADGHWAYWGDAAGPKGRGWYSYDLGPWHVVVLNSVCSKKSVGGCGPDSEQGRWLAADLAANTGKCVLGYWHHPRWSSGAHGTDPSMEPVWQLARAGGVDVVLNGHDHHYERFGVRDGIRQFVVGTGGADRYPVITAEEGSEVRHSQAWGVLKLTLHEDRYDWEFVPAEPTRFTDAGSAPCAR